MIVYNTNKSRVIQIVATRPEAVWFEECSKEELMSPGEQIYSISPGQGIDLSILGLKQKKTRKKKTSIKDVKSKTIRRY